MNQLNKDLYDFRPTSVRLKKENLEWLKRECSRIGISITTAINWMIERSKQRGYLVPPEDVGKPQ